MVQTRFENAEHLSSESIKGDPYTFGNVGQSKKVYDAAAPRGHLNQNGCNADWLLDWAIPI